MEIRDRIKEFRRIKGAELHDNPKNWREHPPAQQTAMLGILREVGVADVLLVRETDEGYQLIDGHLRRNLEPDVDWPCAVLDVDEVEADLILATHDPLAAMAEQNDDRLRELLDSFSPDSEELQKMLDDLKPIEPVEIIQDEVPEVSESEAITKPGDLWLLGEHRLLCGDSTKAEDVGRLMDGAVAQCIFTDPPYGVEYDGGMKKREALASDHIGTDIYKLALPILSKSADDQSALYLWYADGHAAAAAAAAAAAGFVIVAQIIWAKNHAQFVTSAHYKGKHEPCYYAHKKSKSARWHGPNNEVTLWEYDRSPSNDYHPTQKPVAIAARALTNSTDHDDIVIDGFSGGGTTIIAAEQLGRRCYACEIEPRYCDVAVERWEKLTGQKATLSNGG